MIRQLLILMILIAPGLAFSQTRPSAGIVAEPKSSTPKPAELTPAQIDKMIEDWMYGDLKKIEYFGYIHLHFKNKTGTTKLGMTEEEFNDFLKLRFRNNFANVPYREFGSKGFESNDSVGSLWCSVWTVGDDYPVAYHLECRGGSTKTPNMFTDSYLGYGSKSTLADSFKKAIDGMVAKFAIQFFKIRGEM